MKYKIQFSCVTKMLLSCPFHHVNQSCHGIYKFSGSWRRLPLKQHKCVLATVLHHGNGCVQKVDGEDPGKQTERALRL